MYVFIPGLPIETTMYVFIPGLPIETTMYVFIPGLLSISSSLLREQVEKFFKDNDKDLDGKLSWEEFSGK